MELRNAIFSQNFKAELGRWLKENDTTKSAFYQALKEELTKESGQSSSLAYTTFNDWLRGKSYPRDTQMKAICSVLNVTEEELNSFKLTQEDSIRAGLPDRDALERDYGLSPEFLTWYLKVNTGNLFQAQGYIELKEGQYKRILPPLPFNDTEDLTEDIQLTRLRAYTSADLKALGVMERRMIKFLRLLIGEHNDDLRAELQEINRIYKRGDTPELPEGNEQTKKEYKNKEKEIQEALKHGKHKKNQ